MNADHTKNAAGNGQNSKQQGAPVSGDSSLLLKFLHSEEGLIFLFGSCMLILWVLAIAFLWRFGEPVWSDLVTMGLMHIPAGGRAASVAYGIQAGLHPSFVAFLAICLDLMSVCIIYPLLVFSYMNMFERKFFKAHVQQVFESAKKSATRFSRYKIVGVFVFVWIPFWMTGAIGGSILGFLLGLKTWVNLTTVTLSTASAVLCWAYFYDNLFDWLSKIHKGIPLIVVITVILLAALMRIVNTQKKKEGALGT